MKYVIPILGFFGTIINIINITNHLLERFILKTNRYTNSLNLVFGLLVCTIAAFFQIYLTFSCYSSKFIHPCLRFEEVTSKNICMLSINTFYITIFIWISIIVFFPIKYQQVKTNDNQEFYYKELCGYAFLLILFGPLTMIIRGIGCLITNTLTTPWPVLSLDRKLYYIYRCFVLNFIYILIFFKSRKISLKIAELISSIKKEPFGFVYSINNIDQPQKKILFNLSNMLIFFYIIYLASTFYIKLTHPDYAAGCEEIIIQDVGRNSFYFIVIYLSTVFFVSHKNEKEIFFDKLYNFSFIFLIIVPVFIIPAFFKFYISIRRTAISNKDTIVTAIIIVLATALITKFLDRSFKIKEPKEK